jgi:hypothetical protein
VVPVHRSTQTLECRFRGTQGGVEARWSRTTSREVGMSTGVVRRARGLVERVRSLGEEGMTTAEYAVGTVAAVAFAGLLLAIVRSGPVKTALTKIIVTALGTGS